MSVKVAFARLGATIAVSAAVIYGLAQAAPDTPDSYVGPAGPAPSATTSPGSTGASGTVALPPPVVTNTPPPGFPSMRRPPREIEVADGEPQPIDTKFGLSYTVPSDWRNFSTGIAGWEGNGGSITYGAIADYGRGFCPAEDSADLGMTGMIGRNGVDATAAALEVSRQADFIFADSDNPDAVVTYSDPVEFEIDGEPAVRVDADVTGLKVESECESPAASFDIVATTGFSNATVAVFMITLDRGIEGALDDKVGEDILSSLQKIPSERAAR
ncbi:hypothetical protein HQO83_22765 [Rhodococcus fascians]|nr:hypothetical protein [Rhodococcus fascians]